VSVLLRRLDAFWRSPAPALRLASVRLLTGSFALVYLLVRAPVLADFSRLHASDFDPVGIVNVLRAPLPAVFVWGSWALCVLTGAAFTVGVRFALSGPAFALLFLWVTSYRNSWGMVFHTDNLAVIHLLILGLCPAADALAIDARGRSEMAADARYGWPLRLLGAVTVATYVLAGVAKLHNSGVAWASGDILRNYIAYDAMRKIQLGSLHSPFGAWLVQHAWPFPIIGALTFVLELGAPLALLGGRVAIAWVAGIWAFHVGVLLTMAIAFPYPLCGVGFAALLPAERVVRRPLIRDIARWLSDVRK
jgi:hypothetical protein